MSIRTDPWRKIKPKHGEIAYIHAVENVKHLLSDRDLDFLYQLRIERVDRKGRIIARQHHSIDRNGYDSSRIIKLVSQALISSDWATGLSVQYPEAVSSKSTRFKNLLFLPPFLVQMTLPHKPVNGNEFWRKNGDLTLSLLASHKIGLPYGTYARLILMYLTTMRVTSGDRSFYLGESWRDFLDSLRITWGGKKTCGLKAAQEQLKRLSLTTYTVHVDGENFESARTMVVADQWTRTGQGVKIALSEKFFTLSGESVVPLQLPIVHELRRSPLLLDLYAWLSYRAANVRNATLIKWRELELQFGSDYKRPRDFRSKFRKSLAVVLERNPVTPHVSLVPRGLRLEPGSPSDADWAERLQLVAKSRSL